MAEVSRIPILTLTMSPAVDVSTSVKRMVPFSKMRCAQAHRDPGGGGINVARALTRLGLKPTAIYTAGGANGQLLATLLEREGIESVAIPTAGDTREDITIFDETTREQFRLVFPGAALSEIEWQECLRSIAGIEARPAYIIASGSVPPGVPHDFFGRMARASGEHSRIVVDTSGPYLRAALEAGVYLIKPNLHEFQELAETAATDEASLVGAGRALIERYRLEVIALSMGADGALLVTRDMAWRASGIAIAPISVSGAGDSFLGAMVWSLANGNSLQTALRYGVAGGSAALLNPGTELCRPDDVHRLASQVIATPIAHRPR